MAQTTLVLVVEDDANVRSLVQDLLTASGYKVRAVSSVFQAKGALIKLRPDLAIVDRSLPDTDGMQLIKEMRTQDEFKTLPVLFLTARSRPEDKAEGLRSGGDDYLAKPFANQELLARVEALLRRSRTPPEPAHVLRAKGILLDLDRHLVEVSGKQVHLSPKEFDLLAAFLEKPGRVLSRRFLMERVWGEGMGMRMNLKTVDVAIGRLRTALGSWGERITAVQAYGYRLDVEA
ncbi:MAG: response regulator transcription factor [Elusimicrobia bacterium]|nr:response regulator transcription factor [Elusimicrobiota bacterium]